MKPLEKGFEYGAEEVQLGEPAPLVEKRWNERGEEIPDDTPLELPFNAKRPETLQEMIQRYVANEISQAAAQLEAETLEEANDFDVDDEGFGEDETPYEATELVEEQPVAAGAPAGGAPPAVPAATPAPVPPVAGGEPVK